MAVTIRMRNCQVCQRQVVFSRGGYRRGLVTRVMGAVMLPSDSLLRGFKRVFICHRCLWRRRWAAAGIVMVVAGGLLPIVRQTMAG